MRAKTIFEFVRNLRSCADWEPREFAAVVYCAAQAARGRWLINGYDTAQTCVLPDNSQLRVDFDTQEVWYE